MTDEKIVCMSCRKEFVYTDSERLFLEGLLKEKKIPEVIKPKKCLPCRALVRRTRNRASGWYTPPGTKWPPVSPLSPIPVPEALSLGPAYVKLPGAGPTPGALFTSPPSEAPAPHPAGCMCPRCGDQNKLNKPHPMPGLIITPLPPPTPGAPTPEELVILVASDFEQLVCREDVVWRQGNRKITIRLADIGPEAMKRAMEKGVLSWWKS